VISIHEELRSRAPYSRGNSWRTEFIIHTPCALTLRFQSVRLPCFTKQL
jgi:hypothetical protein